MLSSNGRNLIKFNQENMDKEALINKDLDFHQINQIYDECINYLKTFKENNIKVESKISIDDSNVKSDDIYEADISTIGGNPGYETVKEPKENKKSVAQPVYETLKETNQIENHMKQHENNIVEAKNKVMNLAEIGSERFTIENEVSYGNNNLLPTEPKSERLRRLSQQLPRIVITQGSNSSLNRNVYDKNIKEDSNQTNNLRRPSLGYFEIKKENKKPAQVKNIRHPLPHRSRGYGDYPKRLVSKTGLESVALISNVPYEKIRLLNDTFHTLINLRWRWIVIGTVVVHFTIWLVFAVFWYITALAHYDFDPDPPKRSCVTGGKDFVTIFLASVEAQTTIGFGDRAIDEECPEAIFLFIMQLILGTGLSGVLTCVVYAKLTRPEKLSRDGVGFSKNAVICIRDGRLCLMMRAWDLNYDHIISSEFSAHFINTHKTKEGEMMRFYARSLPLQQRQFLLWPVVLVHVIDVTSPLYKYTPESITNTTFEITVSLKGASASMGTFTQSQTSYMPHEILWGHRFPPVVKYDQRKQKYVIDHKKLNATEPLETPQCCAHDLYHLTMQNENDDRTHRSETPSSFSEKISGFVLERTSSFRRNKESHSK